MHFLLALCELIHGCLAAAQCNPTQAYFNNYFVFQSSILQ